MDIAFGGFVLERSNALPLQILISYSFLFLDSCANDIIYRSAGNPDTGGQTSSKRQLQISAGHNELQTDANR